MNTQKTLEAHLLKEQLTTGLQVLLESQNVPKETRKMVGQYMEAVTKGMKIEKEPEPTKEVEIEPEL
jgi:hypothetical protein